MSISLLLFNHGPEKFATIFLGEYDTPEAIWCSEMRQLMIQKIAYHLADFTPRLQSNNRAVYQYCAIPIITYPLLEHELFCDIYYLRNLCNVSKFPSWPIMEPVKLLKEVLGAWRVEAEWIMEFSGTMTKSLTWMENIIKLNLIYEVYLTPFYHFPQFLRISLRLGLISNYTGT